MHCVCARTIYLQLQWYGEPVIYINILLLLTSFTFIKADILCAGIFGNSKVYWWTSCDERERREASDIVSRGHASAPSNHKSSRPSVGLVNLPARHMKGGFHILEENACLSSDHNITGSNLPTTDKAKRAKYALWWLRQSSIEIWFRPGLQYIMFSKASDSLIWFRFIDSIQNFENQLWRKQQNEKDCPVTYRNMDEMLQLTTYSSCNNLSLIF